MRFFLISIFNILKYNKDRKEGDAMDVFLLSVVMLLHPAYGVYLLCRKKYPSALFRIFLPFITLYCLNIHTIGYVPEQSPTETFRQSLMNGNVIAYLGTLAAILWLLFMIIDIRVLIERLHKKSHP